jgi:hypothetical protein
MFCSPLPALLWAQSAPAAAAVGIAGQEDVRSQEWSGESVTAGDATDSVPKRTQALPPYAKLRPWKVASPS